MIHFLNLIHWKAILMILLTQVLVKYALLEPFHETRGVTTTLTSFQFIVLVLATLCIAAAGFIITAIYSLDADKVNTPDCIIISKHIAEKKGFDLFIFFNIIGVGLGLYLSNSIGKPSYFTIFFIASALLYIYATALRQMLLVGNIIISLVVALAILVVGVFELLPVISSSNKEIQIFFLRLILDYAIFIFILNLVKEFIKDIKTIDGDYKVGMQTLPILLGRERATKIAFVLSLIPLFAIVYYIITYFFKQQLLLGYFLIFVVAPLIYSNIKLYTAEHKKQYNFICMLLKFVMLTSVLSMILHSFILN